MILVCDRTVSERATRIRERMLASGFPAAVSALSSIREHLPVRLLVTFTDCFDDLRRMPCGHIFCIAVGDGFVNSALHAVRVRREEEAVPAVLKHLALHEREDPAFGIHLTPEIFRGPGFYEIRGHTLVFTAFEERLFLLLALTTDEGKCATPERIRMFCLSGAPSEDANAVATHVHHLNQKLAPALGDRAIRGRRSSGYYLMNRKEFSRA
ncbi:MAG: helix-turn-helix domain-containing protein [Clostridia bacterium]|nr:helix-turn-helix domain-containing protein [Clostridia bacterium]